MAKSKRVAPKQHQDDERPIQTRLTRLPLSEEAAADLVAFLLRIAEEKRTAREVKERKL